MFWSNSQFNNNKEEILGGGLPVGSIWRREIMEMVAPTEPMYQGGTLSGSPLAMTAGSWRSPEHMMLRQDHRRACSRHSRCRKEDGTCNLRRACSQLGQCKEECYSKICEVLLQGNAGGRCTLCTFTVCILLKTSKNLKLVSLNLPSPAGKKGPILPTCSSVFLNYRLTHMVNT